MVTEQPAAPSRFAVRPWMVVLAACLIYLTWVFVSRGADPLAFVTLAQPPSAEYPEGYDGYDGQFTYYIALNPVQSPPYLDVPAYRLQRILLPLLGFLLSFGQPALVPWALLAINVAALTVGTLLLERLLDEVGTTRWFALVYGLFPGVLMAPRLSTSEALAYGLALAALWAGQRRPWLSALLFALAGLAKEPALVLALGALLWLILRRRWFDALRLGLVSWIPFFAWQLALFGWLGSPGFGAGGRYATAFEAIPYMGYLRIYTETGNLPVFLALSVLVIPWAIVPSVWGIAVSVRDLLARHRHQAACLLLINAAVIAILPFSTLREPLGLLRFLPGLVIAFVLAAATRPHPRMRLYGLVWLSALALMIVSV